MVAKAYACSAPRARGNPFASLLSLLRQADTYLFPAHLNAGQGIGHGQTTDVNAWIPLLTMPGTARMTHPGLIIPSSQSQPDAVYWR